MVNPFDGGDFYPEYDDGRGECDLAEWFGSSEPCSGVVKMRPMRTGIIPCCEHHFDLS